MHLSGSQKTQSSHSNISIGEDEDNDTKPTTAAADNGESEQTNSSELNVESKGNDEDMVQGAQAEDLLARQVSTTEYLAGMVHTKTPEGLLPLFPSWSLMCIGASSIYSHNTGEHDCK
jgi:protein SMG8